MVEPNVKDRYGNAKEALEALKLRVAKGSIEGFPNFC
jgi:hypothetical protein